MNQPLQIGTPKKGAGMKDVTSKPQEYITSAALAVFLNVSERTIQKHTYHIPGRTKFGRSVRYHFPTIKQHLLAGKDLFTKPKNLVGKKQFAIGKR